MLRVLCPLLVLMSSGCATTHHGDHHVSPERTGFYSPFEPASEGFVRCYQKQFACTPANIRRDRAMEARRQAQERANHRGDDW
ncbi:hypothetical protein HBJ00_11730 [Aeromonas veronii]|uniref:hypothetical protein n=1 Tax=Aeromonas veronii TaxID=654 RepID=UPI00143182A1|nr:hypothetical protein [Aeromonas veronii]NJI19350.1 hypothetical protein [Aeromonas veronii]